MVEEMQRLIRFHVDDILFSHRNPKVNDKFANWAQEKHGGV